MTAIAVLPLVVALLLVGRLYQVSRRRVARRDAELTLTREACDRQTVKARHFKEQAVDLRGEVARLSARNSEMRDQLDLLTGARTEPTLTEEFLAWLAEEPITYPEDPR